ncbi:MAG: hypothetical protein QOI74_226 [Micromonosporaceae bacterium]|nr:hypothetical protein [Micromonosporaceae bacterium]
MADTAWDCHIIGVPAVSCPGPPAPAGSHPTVNTRYHHDGLSAAATGSTGGRGLWLVQTLADNVDIRSGPAGTTVTAAICRTGH